MKKIYPLFALLSILGYLSIQLLASHYDWSCMETNMDGARLTVQGVMCYREAGIGREYIPLLRLQEIHRNSQDVLDCEAQHPNDKYRCNPAYIPPASDSQDS